MSRLPTTLIKKIVRCTICTKHRPQSETMGTQVCVNKTSQLFLSERVIICKQTLPRNNHSSFIFFPVSPLDLLLPARPVFCMHLSFLRTTPRTSRRLAVHTQHFQIIYTFPKATFTLCDANNTRPIPYTLHSRCSTRIETSSDITLNRKSSHARQRNSRAAQTRLTAVTTLRVCAHKY